MQKILVPIFLVMLLQGCTLGYQKFYSQLAPEKYPETSKVMIFRYSNLDLQGIYGYAKATCNRALVLLKLLYNLGRRWKIAGAESSPCTDVHYFETNNAREFFLNMTRLNAFI